MIFEALQSELSRFKFDILSSKILKIPEFNLTIDRFAVARKAFEFDSFLRNGKKFKTAI